MNTKRVLSAMMVTAMLASALPTASAHWVEHKDDEVPKDATTKVTYLEATGSTAGTAGEVIRYFDNKGNDDYAPDNGTRDHYWDPITSMNNEDIASDKAVVTLLQDIKLEDTTILVDTGYRKEDTTPNTVTIQSDGKNAKTITCTMTGSVEPNEGGSNAPGMDAFSITKGATLVLDGVKVVIKTPGETTARAAANATQGIYNAGSLVLKNGAEVSITGVSQNGISGSGSLEVAESKVTIQDVDRSGIIAGSVSVSDGATVAIGSTGYHGISSDSISVSGENTSVSTSNVGQASDAGNYDITDVWVSETFELTGGAELKAGADGKGKISLNSDVEVTVAGSKLDGNLVAAQDATPDVTISSSEVTGTVPDGSNISGDSTVAGKVVLGTDAIIPAALKDNPTAGAVEITDLYEQSTYKVTIDTLKAGEMNQVKIAVNQLKEHTNANGAKGHWVGFAVKAPKDAVKMKFAFADSETGIATLSEAIELEENIDSGKGIAFYTDAGAEKPKTYAAVQFVDAQGKELTDVYKFKMDLTDVKLYQEGTDPQPGKPGELVLTPQPGGLGQIITVKATNQGQYLTVQVTKGGTNAIYMVPGTEAKISVPTGCTVQVWETQDAPQFTNGVINNAGVLGYGSVNV